MDRDSLLSVVLAGAGGYGNFYISYFLDQKDPSLRLAGVVARTPERVKRLADLRAAKIPLYPTLEAFYAADRADCAILVTPMHLHLPHTAFALSRGSHVLCEKPLCVAIQDAAPMIAARDAAGRLVAIAYQWSFSRAIQDLKRDILAGAFGRPIRFKTLAHWVRDDAYYSRNTWVAALRDPEGNWVLDSPVNNANAHSLHNMLFLLGDAMDRSARVETIEGELYRARPVQNFDTAMVRVRTAAGAEVLLYCSHVTEKDRDPVSELEFEKAVVRIDQGAGTVDARWTGGATRAYGSPDAEPYRKITDTAEAIRHGRKPLCGIETAIPLTLCVNGLYESMRDIVDVPASLIRVEGAGPTTRRRIEGLDDVLAGCFAKAILPSQAGVPWARRGKVVDLTDYRYFPGGREPAGRGIAGRAGG
jgi:predicted dehydrogenase